MRKVSLMNPTSSNHPQPTTGPSRSLPTRGGLSSSPEVGSVGDFVEKYTSFRAQVGNKESTLEQQSYALRWALYAAWGDPITEIGASMVEDAFVRARNLSTGGSWANSCGQQVRAWCEWLQRRKLLDTDLSACWPVVPEEPQRKKVALTAEDYRLIRCRLRGWSRLGVDFFWWTGLRKANVLGLRWDRFAPDLSSVVIPKEEFKQGVEHRQLIPEPLRRELLAYPRSGDYVLGRRAAPSIGKAIRKAAIKAGIDPEITYPHNWRASCCMRLREQGIPDIVVAKFMGWANCKTMEKYYQRPIPLDRIADSINSVCR